MGRKADNKIGEINYNRFGTKMTIIKYTNSHNIEVEFENGYIARNMGYNAFKMGSILNPLDKSTYKIGYLGIGKHNVSKNGKATTKYEKWRKMLRRCYDDKCHEKQPTYIGCTVCEEWHNYQSFGDWFDENYYEVDGERMCLDKDILVKGNKIYSPETCIIVPEKINILFVKNNKDRGKYPIGVGKGKGGRKFIAMCKYIPNKNVYFGTYPTPEEAFYKGYKPFKEKHIKEVAEEYKDKIPLKLYNAMYRYEVEITD